MPILILEHSALTKDVRGLAYWNDIQNYNTAYVLAS